MRPSNSSGRFTACLGLFVLLWGCGEEELDGDEDELILFEKIRLGLKDLVVNSE